MKLSAATASAILAFTQAESSPLPVRLETRSSLNSRLTNIHLSITPDILPTNTTLTVTYGSCYATSPSDAHHELTRSASSSSSYDRLVWVLPDDAYSGGCLSAWSSSGALLGRSTSQSLSHHARRAAVALARRGPESIAMTNSSGIDAWGEWFDGVELLSSKNLSSVDAAAAKEKNIAIVGAGMSGLMTYLCLHQAGFTNVSIIEAGERLGGRVHTVYLSGGPFDYSYQEMGPMRFPETITLKNETYNITDHQLVFQLAQEMNGLNGGDKNLSVDFIPWYQSSENGLYYYDGIRTESGLPPTLAQVAANASLSVTLADDESTAKVQAEVDAALPGTEFYITMAQNMFKAHREWLDGGLDGLPGDQWSETAFMVNYLQSSLNDSDVIGASTASSFWDTLYEGMYFDATTYKTIDGGLNRLPLSFHPLVDPITTMNRSIERVRFDSSSQKVTLSSRKSYNDDLVSSEHDYAILSAPFSVLKKWRIDGLPTTMTDAIANVPYGAACKVALEFSTRFWEHLPSPIHGSCSTSTDIPGIGSICYPSYNINGTGPATMLGSYVSGDWGARWVSTSEEEHVAYVLNVMAEIHGDVVLEQYTGKYNRRCWMLDPLESASWASPTVGQHSLYLPEYFKTHNNMIFVGEHTSYTHAWIASALESGIRGSVQLMLELGLVDEAKMTVEKWMARWMDV